MKKENKIKQDLGYQNSVLSQVVILTRISSCDSEYTDFQKRPTFEP